MSAVSKHKNLWRVLAAAYGFAGCCGAASASTYSVIFLVKPQLGPITSDFVADASSLIYGTGRGAAGSGFQPGGILQLTPPAEVGQGGTIRDFLFTPGATGFWPTAGVTLSNGAILGTTSAGGLNNAGTVFRLQSGGELIDLHDFSFSSVRPADGNTPNAGLIEGPSRLLYGTTYGGGNFGRGVVFAVSPSSAKAKYSAIHDFGAAGDGANPGYGRLAVDSQGRLFGTTQNGGANSLGTIFMMQRVGGKWQEQVIYSFTPAPDLLNPVANVALDSAGNLYGCALGGSHGQGGVFQLSPPVAPGSSWTETILYNFGDAPLDPVASNSLRGCGVTRDAATGRLFGTSWAGGKLDQGTIWQLDPPAPGQTAWTETIIHSFFGSKGDGGNPVGAPLQVGASYYGGNSGGNIYQFTP